MNYTFDNDSFSDLHKDARGFRPKEGFYNWLESATCEQKQVMWDDLIAELNLRESERATAEAEAVKKFEGKVADVIAFGAMNRETAIRWIFEAENDEYIVGDPDYFCYNYGLPYGYFKLTA